MKQKIVLRKKTNNKLPKSLQDEKDHNFTVYFCLNEDSKDINFKPFIMFAKTKDARLKNVTVKEIVDVTKKDYRFKTYCLLLNCNSAEYVTFKHYFAEVMKKHLAGQLEATESDIQKFAEKKVD